MRVAIIGASGLLGTDLLEGWAGDEIIPATSREVDIRDSAQVHRFLLRERPDWIILAAAFTDVDGSEKSPELAFAINRDGTKNVATAAHETGAKLLYLSTDYVFDGLCDRPYEPIDPIRPLSVYGASKAAGEQTIQERARALGYRSHLLAFRCRTPLLSRENSLCRRNPIRTQSGQRPDRFTHLHERSRQRHSQTGPTGCARNPEYHQFGCLFVV